MIQYMIVTVIVGAITACFFGVSAALTVGRELTAIWIVAGLVVTILGPFFNFIRFFRYLSQRTIGFFHR